MPITVKLTVTTTNGNIPTEITLNGDSMGGNPRFNSAEVERITERLTARIRDMFEGTFGEQELNA